MVVLKIGLHTSVFQSGRYERRNIERKTLTQRREYYNTTYYRLSECWIIFFFIESRVNRTKLATFADIREVWSALAANNHQDPTGLAYEW